MINLFVILQQETEVSLHCCQAFLLYPVIEIAKFSATEDQAATKNAHACRISAPRDSGSVDIRLGVGVDCFSCSRLWRAPIAIEQNIVPRFFRRNCAAPGTWPHTVITLSPSVHIGKRIREVLDSHPKHHTVKWFAGELHCDRRNAYNIFERRNIDVEMLRRVSVVLGHDFFSELSEELKSENADETSEGREARESPAV